jgi:uncharacterized protein with von Willebrand factor type A (vWA) domain
MSTKARIAIRREADLVACFTRSYRAKLARTIDLLNTSLRSPEPRADATSMRCCIEAVDLVLASHEQFAKSLVASLNEDQR